LEKISVYKIAEIPDAQYHQYQMKAGGNVLAGVVHSFKHLLRFISGLSAGSVSVSIRFHFEPFPKNKDCQSRLKIYLIVRTDDSGIDCNLNILLESGPLKDFVRLEKMDRFEAHWESYKAICEIVRREDLLKPLHDNDMNYKMPPFYYTISSLEPNERNDYADLDRVLARVEETVILEVCVEPADIRPELREHTQYIAHLQPINRTWDNEEEDDKDFPNEFDDRSHRNVFSPITIQPLQYKDPLADDTLRIQQRFHQSLLLPHLMFKISVLAESRAVAQLIGSVFAESGFENGSYRLVHRTRGDKFFEKHLLSVKAVHIISQNDTSILNAETSKLYAGMARLSCLATVDELSGLIRIPVAFQESPNCIRKNTDPPGSDPQNSIIIGADADNSGNIRGISCASLCKHFFINGTPGSGKTVAGLNLALELHRHETPFLVIDPAKTEYRILKTFGNHTDKNAKSLSEALEIYTPGDESVSPFRLNPFELLPGVFKDEHIDNLLWALKAAMPLEGPLLPILGEALEAVYESHPDPENPPQMTDLADMAYEVLAQKGYSQEVHANIKAALDVRLGMLTRGSIGKVFDCRQSNPGIKHLMEVPAVIELDHLHPEQACLLTLFLLTHLREYLKTLQKSNKNPRYVIIIEEAHNIVGKTGPATPSADNADPKSFAVEFICRMLAETRSLGVAIGIIDQLPSTVASEVIKNTGTKLAFRQVSAQDRQDLGATMLFGDWEFEEIARNVPGELFFYTEGFYRPVKVKGIDITKKFDFNKEILAGKIVPYIQEDQWFKNAALERHLQGLEHLREGMDDFDRKRLSLIRELAKLRQEYARVIVGSGSVGREKPLEALKGQTFEIQRNFNVLHRTFFKNVYKKRLPLLERQMSESNLEEFRRHLEDRYELIIQPDLKGVQDHIESFLAEINHSLRKERS
jgi:hypothetical protein